MKQSITKTDKHPAYNSMNQQMIQQKHHRLQYPKQKSINNQGETT